MNRNEWASAFHAQLGLPDNPQTRLATVTWIASENSTAKFNPLDTTEDWPNATEYNSAGVKNYDTLQDGLNATVTTFHNGLYGGIATAYHTTNPQAMIDAIAASPWGSKPSLDLLQTVESNAAYGEVLISGTTESVPPVTDAPPAATGDAPVEPPANEPITDAKGDTLQAPIVGACSVPGGGYYLVAADGGVFAFDSAYHGSIPDLRAAGKVTGPLKEPAVAIIANDGNGYAVICADGGVFTFGNYKFGGAA